MREPIIDPSDTLAGAPTKVIVPGAVTANPTNDERNPR